jgi:two-component system, chemotaxis family, sensor histidine kinase and response regulator PixL
MSIEPDLRDRVYQMFLLEVPRMLQTIEIELVTLSLDRSVTKVNNLLRAAHSIKGCAASLGLAQIQDLAHQIEDIFRVLNHPELPWNRELEELLFEIYDCLAQIVNCQITDKPLPTGIHTKTQIVLADLDDAIGHFVIVGQRLPDAISFGVDLTQSIFEVDVAQSLARLQRVLLDPACYDVAVGEFRAQSEVFTGIAELVTLPGFGSIAHATIAALDRHPARAHEICCFALVDFYTALEAVLTGDRHSGGAISPGFAWLLAEAPRLLDANADWAWVLEESQISTALPSERVEPIDLCAPVAAPPVALTSIESAGVDSFDLEDLFDLNITATDVAVPAFDLIADFLNESSTSQIESGITLPLRSTDIPLAPLAVAREDWFDYLLEDLLTSAAIPVFMTETSDDLSSFDLVDIFEIPSPVSTAEAPPPQIAGGVDRAFELRSIVAELTSSFDRLSPVSPDELAKWQQAPTGDRAEVIVPSIPKLNRRKKSRKIDPATTAQLTVRVALDRLERMNNCVGELAIERNGLALHGEQAIDTIRELRSKCENFQAIGDRLRKLADSLSISARYQTLDSAHSALSNDLSQKFDDLELDRYGELHSIAQETVEQIAQIEEQIEDLTLFTTQSDRQIDRQKQLLTYLRDDLMWARMLPLGEILNRFPRTIHDLSVKYHKPVDLKITGAGVLIDRAAIEKLLDPLVHILRNAFDHGIDPPAARQAAGKPDRGLIEITAYHQGSQTIIEVRDDGGGIDLDRIKAKAIALKLLATDASPTEEQILDTLFSPGFSTAAKVTELSGRGMGLDIVKEQIQAIKGTISIQSQLGRGTTFTLRIPLTLTIAQLTICEAGKAIYAFPTDSIQRIVVPTATQIEQQGDLHWLHWHNLKIPIYNLADLLTYSIPVAERTISYTLKTGAKNPSDWLAPLLLIRTGEQVVGLQIDRTIGEQELTIKPFGKAVTPASYSYGCTILGDGSILPVLDPHTLIRVTIDRPHCALISGIPTPQPTTAALILVIDDSVTTRQSLCLTLEKYGYRTLQAKDGQEALQLLREKATEIKLAICDVEMPNMNGFEFLNVRRQDPALTHIPVVMLTSRSNDKHRQFATHLGAIDYFIKPYVETTFVRAIEQLF